MDVSALMIVRAVHILVASLWFGAGLLLTVVVMPAFREAGLDGASMMQRFKQRRLAVYMASMSGLTVLTGLWLFWKASNGLDAQAMHSSAVMVLGLGAICGMVAAVLAGAILGRGADAMTDILASASALPDGAERDARLHQLSVIQRRFARASVLVIALMLLAMACMTLSHVL